MVFVLIINWYLDFKDIISRVGIDIIFIIIMGNRIDNIKMIECRVINNNKFLKIVFMIFNIECKFGYLINRFFLDMVNIKDVIGFVLSIILKYVLYVVW